VGEKPKSRFFAALRMTGFEVVEREWSSMSEKQILRYAQNDRV
jgi:hypothetical protein